MSRFYGPVRVPSDVGPGKARVTISYPGWPYGKIAPVTAEVEVVEQG